MFPLDVEIFRQLTNWFNYKSEDCDAKFNPLSMHFDYLVHAPVWVLGSFREKHLYICN